ncbi:hypothetical protein RB195_008903 [Necator americanus]|uniref:Uncharacterized protein n=1 Tax=Necator americanus TaxID=51031 RepID=A0ABR1CRP0_NECAM
MKSTILFFLVFVAAVAFAKPNPRIHSDSSSEEGPKHRPHHNHHVHHRRRSSPKPLTTVVSPTAPEKSDGTTPFADLTTTDEILVTDVSTDVITSEQVTASDDSSVATLELMDNRAFAVQSRQISGDKVNITEDTTDIITATVLRNLARPQRARLVRKLQKEPHRSLTTPLQLLKS